MPAVLEASPEERLPLAFVTAVEISRASQGTREHRDLAEGLREVYSTLLDAPDGPLQLDFSNDELYWLGVRIFADASELHEYWLDNRSSLRAIQEQAPYPDDAFGRALERFYPEVASHPDDFNPEVTDALLQSLSLKIDAAIRRDVPRVRAIYNKERAEIIRRTRETQQERAAQRARRFPRRADVEIWRPTVRVDDLGVGEMTEVAVEGRRILVARLADGYHAIDAVCTHVPQLGTLGSMVKGELDADRGCVTCPWHGSQFDLHSGKVVRQPYAPDYNRSHFFSGRLTSVLDPKKTASDTRVYPTRIVGNLVMIDIAWR